MTGATVIRLGDKYIELYVTEVDGSITTLSLMTNNTLYFRGVEVSMKDYTTIPEEFRYALETAFPKLISRTATLRRLPLADVEATATAKSMQGMLSFESSSVLAIPVDTSTGEPRTDARALHARLGSKQDFSDWFNKRTNECDLVKDQDYGVCSINLWSKECGVGSKGRGGHNTIDYWLTLDAAKEMAMMERNEQGKAIRRYLIEVEKAYRAQQQPAAVVKLPQTYVEALRALADSAEEAQQLKIRNLEAQQVIGETRAQLVTTEIKLENTEDQLELMVNKIELPNVSILTEEFCKLYGNALGVTEGVLFDLLCRHKILYRTKRGIVPYETDNNHRLFDVSVVKFFNVKNGELETSSTTRWTPAGVAWLRNYLLRHPDMLLSQLLVAKGSRKQYQRLKGLKLIDRTGITVGLPAEGWIDYGEVYPSYWNCSTRRDGIEYQGNGKSLKEALCELANILPTKKRVRRKRSGACRPRRGSEHGERHGAAEGEGSTSDAAHCTPADVRTLVWQQAEVHQLVRSMHNGVQSHSKRGLRILCSPNLGSKECGVGSERRRGHNTIDYWLTLDATTERSDPARVGWHHGLPAQIGRLHQRHGDVQGSRKNDRSLEHKH